jgi:hypothetical protein
MENPQVAGSFIYNKFVDGRFKLVKFVDGHIKMYKVGKKEDSLLETFNDIHGFRTNAGQFGLLGSDIILISQTLCQF